MNNHNKDSISDTEDLKTQDVDNKTDGLLADQEFEFMKEKIKDRPINRKKLIRRTIITASMAVVFGLIACLTFLVLEPVFSNWLLPEEEPTQVAFPEVEEEMLPEDMIQKDSQIATLDMTTEEATESDMREEDIATSVMPLKEYQLLYDDLYTIAKNSTKSMVTVTGVTSDIDWFNNTYESKGQTSGLIVANNGKELLILVDSDTIEKAETIQVTFCDDVQAIATVVASDSNTNLSIIKVLLEAVPADTRTQITLATLGSSNGSHLTGMPVVAVGTPMGTGGSVVYGMLTSSGNTVNVVDNSYQLLTTDMYGSATAGGVLLDMQGQVIGVIDMQYNSEEAPNLISAIGITELKKTIEKLSNGKPMAYLGIYGTDVTQEANESLQVPYGAFVTEIVMESPAMLSGIQSGDVIVKMGEEEIDNYRDYKNVMSDSRPEEATKITVMRQGKEGYREMTFDITMGTLE
ncbi:MAG: S1C family serine protease [Lachnospiraceae bacterium]